MLDFRRHRQGARRGPHMPRYLLMLVAASVVVLLLMLRARPIVNEAVPENPAGGPTARVGRANDEVDAPAERVRADQLFPGVTDASLEPIRDNTVFRSDESATWFGWLKLLQGTDRSDLRDLPATSVGYLQLDRQPAAYRGRLVELTGTVRRAKEVAAPENDLGLKRYYQLWLQPQRGEPELVVLYVLELPQDFPLGDELDQRASARGLFFKLWAYPAQGGILTAPLVLAKNIEWQPPPAAAKPAPLNEQIMLAIGTAVLLALAAIGWIVVRSRRTDREIRAAENITIAVPDDNP